jgi:hypothetical protein
MPNKIEKSAFNTIQTLILSGLLLILITSLLRKIFKSKPEEPKIIDEHPLNYMYYSNLMPLLKKYHLDHQEKGVLEKLLQNVFCDGLNHSAAAIEKKLLKRNLLEIIEEYDQLSSKFLNYSFELGPDIKESGKIIADSFWLDIKNYGLRNLMDKENFKTVFKKLLA